MNTRNNQLARLHILLNEQGIDSDTKREIYASYGVSSSKGMTDYQLRHLIARLEGHDLGPAPAVQPRQDVSSETRRLRSQCLSLMTRPYDETLAIKQRGLGIPNGVWSILNPFIQNHTGATLNQLSDGDLMRFRKMLMGMRESGWNWPDYAKKNGLNPNTGRPESKKSAPVTPLLVIPANNNTIN